MKNFKNHLFLITSVMFLFIGSCRKDDIPETGSPGLPIITEFGDPLGQADELTIGPEGGTINSSDGLLTVTIPQGALSGSTVISIQPIINQAPLGLGNGYRLGPEGISLAKPVTLNFHYSEDLLDSRPPEFLWIVFQESDGSWKAMLKSALNTGTKTVTVETSHFSNWSLGTFADLTLEPDSKTVAKGSKTELAIIGFVNSKENDELAPLKAPPKDDLELLVFLSTNEYSFRVVEWTLNGMKAPVSNNFGSLQPSKNSASFTAPLNVPSPNTVAVSVKLEMSSKTGTSSTYYLTSNITILKGTLFLKVHFKGNTYIYYQYGMDPTVTPDPNNFSIIHCGLSEGRLHLGGGTFTNNAAKDEIEIFFDNPKTGSRGMVGLGDHGRDNLNFSILNPYAYYDLENVTRTRDEDNKCFFEKDESNHVTMNLTKYLGPIDPEVKGSFLGTLYYEDQSYGPDCKSSSPYPISGDFNLILNLK